MFGLDKFLQGLKYKDEKRQLSEDIAKEMGRRKNQANRILSALIVYGDLTTIDLEQMAFNYTGRISDLRKRGYIIECEYQRPGVFGYHYYGYKPDTRAARERTGTK